MSKLHDRMPVILAPEDQTTWLESKDPPTQFLRPYPSELLLCRDVSTRVNSPKNNDPTCLEPDRGLLF